MESRNETTEKKGTLMWLGIALAFSFGAWGSWQATSSLWRPSQDDAPTIVSTERGEVRVQAPRTQPPANRASAAAKRRIVQLISVETAGAESGGTRVSVAGVLAQLQLLEPLTHPNRAKCRRILNNLTADGLVEEDSAAGFVLTESGAQALADWRERR